MCSEGVAPKKPAFGLSGFTFACSRRPLNIRKASPTPESFLEASL
jgi:hypothetical protein